MRLEVLGPNSKRCVLIDMDKVVAIETELNEEGEWAYINVWFNNESVVERLERLERKRTNSFPYIEGKYLQLQYFNCEHPNNLSSYEKDLKLFKEVLA